MGSYTEDEHGDHKYKNNNKDYYINYNGAADLDDNQHSLAMTCIYNEMIYLASTPKNDL